MSYPDPVKKFLIRQKLCTADRIRICKITLNFSVFFVHDFAFTEWNTFFSSSVSSSLRFLQYCTMIPPQASQNHCEICRIRTRGTGARYHWASFWCRSGRLRSTTRRTGAGRAWAVPPTRTRLQPHPLLHTGAAPPARWQQDRHPAGAQGLLKKHILRTFNHLVYRTLFSCTLNDFVKHFIDKNVFPGLLKIMYF